MSWFEWNGEDEARAVYRDGRLSLYGRASMMRADDVVAVGIDVPAEQRRDLAEALLADCEVEPEIVTLLKAARAACYDGDTSAKLQRFIERVS